MKDGKPFESAEPVGIALQRLLEQEEFKIKLRWLCETYCIHTKVVKNCLGGLYRISCKGKHGHGRNILVYAKYWRKEELLALGAIFEYFNIRFTYWNKEGKETSFPYVEKCRYHR